MYNVLILVQYWHEVNFAYYSYPETYRNQVDGPYECIEAWRVLEAWSSFLLQSWCGFGSSEYYCVYVGVSRGTHGWLSSYLNNLDTVFFFLAPLSSCVEWTASLFPVGQCTYQRCCEYTSVSLAELSRRLLCCYSLYPIIIWPGKKSIFQFSFWHGQSFSNINTHAVMLYQCTHLDHLKQMVVVPFSNINTHAVPTHASCCPLHVWCFVLKLSHLCINPYPLYMTK